LGILKIDSGGVFAQASNLDTVLRSFFNDTVFSLTGAELPGGYMDLFAAGTPGIIADRGVLALLIGTIIITATQVNRAWIPAVWLAVFAFLVRMAGALVFGGAWWGGDMLFALSTGGVLIAAFILASDPATGAKSNCGILGASIAGAVLAFFFRFYGGEAYGAVFAVLVVNALLPIVRAFEAGHFYDKRRSHD
jgi:electron transport complex protein RnfD